MDGLNRWCLCIIMTWPFGLLLVYDETVSMPKLVPRSHSTWLFCGNIRKTTCSRLVALVQYSESEEQHQLIEAYPHICFKRMARHAKSLFCSYERRWRPYKKCDMKTNTLRVPKASKNKSSYFRPFPFLWFPLICQILLGHPIQRVIRAFISWDILSHFSPISFLAFLTWHSLLLFLVILYSKFSDLSDCF